MKARLALTPTGDPPEKKTGRAMKTVFPRRVVLPGDEGKGDAAREAVNQSRGTQGKIRTFTIKATQERR
ncbi:hypothetical protein E2C01_085294 [Portunus trituberculatus]|uniref:Uncharacterized protein n=1 Tax=Portunus trituberculatus TaxID=210409 RepID=A0A5B7JA33_PORTR|nr:hypothetical protein [Portunus trituberculatus]